ncbi:unnamed protein product, partial [Owenia fusiformis]
RHLRNSAFSNMRGFCGSPFWDSQLTLNTTNPSLTPCFQSIILTWIPCVYLFIVAIAYSFQLKTTTTAFIKKNWLNTTKTVLGCVLVVLTLADIFRGAHEYATGQPMFPVMIVTPVLQFVAMVLATLFIQWERIRGIRSSGYLFCFWLLVIIGNIFIYKSKIEDVISKGDNADVFRFVTFTLHYVLVLVQAVLASLVDAVPENLDIPENACPEEHSSFLSRITFWWFTRLVVKGYKKALEIEDLWGINREDLSKNVVRKFQAAWMQEMAKSKKSKQQNASKVQAVSKDGDIELKTPLKGQTDYDVTVKTKSKKGYEPSLVKSMAKAFGGTFLIGSLFKLINDILMFVSPQLLKLLIGFTRNKDDPLWKGYMYAALMFIVALFQSIILHQYFHKCFVVGMRLRTVIIASVYSKALNLSNSARKSSTVGEIVNLMSVDAQRFMELTTYLNMLWSAPFQISVSLYFLWMTLGPSVLAGLAVMVLLIPINALIATKARSLQVRQMKQKDSRIKLMNEVLNGIKVLKLYAWELSFKEKILGIRNDELDVLKKAAYLNAASSFTWTCAPFMVSLTTFAVYVLSSPENVLDAEKAFVSLSLFNILRFPLSMLPMLISNIVQASVSVKRLTNFLKNEELDPDNVQHDDVPDYAISVEGGSFQWDKDLKEDEQTGRLDNIDMKIKDGALVAVVGTVGSGKSSLLAAMLGEMEKNNGKVNVKGSVAYVPQQAWIQNCTLKDNILFGAETNQDSYDKIIEACALTQDLQMLPGGDQTEIGEKGINLSGGQKQRVSLARAVYSDNDIYLLDDPLSAVDSHVGKHIFEKVIGPEGYLKNKTRVLVTHGIGFLPQVDQIIVLEQGQIREMGSYTELLDSGRAFADFLRNYLTDLDSEELEELDPDAMTLKDDILSHIGSLVEGADKLQRSISKPSRTRTTSEMSKKTASQHSLNKSLSGSHAKLNKQVAIANDKADPVDVNKLKDGDEKEKLIQAETSKTGRVKLKVFAAYMRSVGMIISVLICLLYILNNVASIYSNIWLSDWSNDAARQTNVTSQEEMNKHRDMRLGVYGALGFAQGLVVLGSAFAMAIGKIRASKGLHKSMLDNILQSPQSFFDATPLGRIINRFSKDIDTIDLLIPANITMFLTVMLISLASIIVIAMSTPYILAIMIPIAIVYFFVQRFYVATSRQLKRLESVSRSPIYSHFGESVTGASTIRAYGQRDRFIQESEAYVDKNQICYYPSIVSNRWLAIRLELVGNCIVLFAALFAVIGRDHLSAGIVGLSITYALNITQTLNWMVRMTSELETNIVAVERVKEYSETPTEADWIVEDNRPSEAWPEQGVVEFTDYSTRYREGLDLVLKGISCKINAGEKVGIVGRTGAGKSSLTLSLFRIIESAEGSISIDGIDISKIGLHDLRSKLTIIPQDPVLFSGTLRMNLDPFNTYSDDDLWKALEYGHLKSFVTSVQAGLDYECSEGGENLSVGQRQLVCLARALLRKTKILILDEATAAVDLETDDLIQSTIRTQFSECTVLTIAHRLNTIMDYTRIMVLDAGKVAEFEAPQDLLQNKDSIFYGMAKDAGLAD